MRAVEVNIHIKTTPHDVIQAFTDPQALSDWWHVARALIEKKTGGLYVLTWKVTDNGFGFVSSGIIEKYIPDRELVISNFVYLNPAKSLLGPMRLLIKAIQMDEITDVYLCQDGYQDGYDWDWYYHAVKSAWPEVMQNLKMYLENKKHKA